MVHADNQYDPALVERMVKPIEAGHRRRRDRARGCSRTRRSSGGMPRWKWVGNRALTAVENLVFRRGFSEYHTGYRAFSADFLRRVAFLRNSDDFVFDQEIFAQIVAERQPRGRAADPDPLLPRGVERLVPRVGALRAQDALGARPLPAAPARPPLAAAAAAGGAARAWPPRRRGDARPARCARNTAAQALGKVGVLAAGAASIAVTTRYLGTAGYGSFALALALLQMLGVLADAGLVTVVVREISRDAARGPATWSATRSRCGCCSAPRSSCWRRCCALALAGYAPDVREAILIAAVPFVHRARRPPRWPPSSRRGCRWAARRSRTSAGPAGRLRRAGGRRGGRSRLPRCRRQHCGRRRRRAGGHGRLRSPARCACGRRTTARAGASCCVPAVPLGLTLAVNEIYFRADTFILSLSRPVAEVGHYTLAYRIFELLAAPARHRHDVRVPAAVAPCSPTTATWPSACCDATARRCSSRSRRPDRGRRAGARARARAAGRAATHFAGAADAAPAAAVRAARGVDQRPARLRADRRPTGSASTLRL